MSSSFYNLKEADAALRAFVVPQLQADDELRKAVLRLGEEAEILTLGQVKHYTSGPGHRPQPDTSLRTGMIIQQFIYQVHDQGLLRAVAAPKKRVGRPRKQQPPKKKNKKEEEEDDGPLGGYAAREEEEEALPLLPPIFVPDILPPSQPRSSLPPALPQAWVDQISQLIDARLSVGAQK